LYKWRWDFVLIEIIVIFSGSEDSRGGGSLSSSISEAMGGVLSPGGKPGGKWVFSACMTADARGSVKGDGDAGKVVAIHTVCEFTVDVVQIRTTEEIAAEENVIVGGPNNVNVQSEIEVANVNWEAGEYIQGYTSWSPLEVQKLHVGGCNMSRRLCSQACIWPIISIAKVPPFSMAPSGLVQNFHLATCHCVPCRESIGEGCGVVAASLLETQTWLRFFPFVV
jgi:hypothetical protein